MVRRLTKGLKDPEGWISERRVGFLLSYTASDFTDEAKSILHQMIITGTPSRDVLLVVGVADMKEEMPLLEKLLIDEVKYKEKKKMWWYTTGWAARLARARMGSKPDIEKCIELVEKEDDDMGNRLSILLRHLSYIRQPEAVESLNKYLNINKRLIGPDGSPERPRGSLVAALAAERLLEMIEGFPFGEGIDICRKWMSEQKEWKIIR